MGLLRSWIDRITKLSRWATIWSAIRLLTWRVRKKAGWAGRSLKRVNLRASRGALYMRIGRSSDYDVFKQVFIEEEFKPVRAIREARVIVDCGANVGYASRYLLDVFPMARLIAIEPDPENAAICRLNLKPYGDRASLRQAAVWREAAQLSLVRGAFGDGREWATQVRALGEDESGDVAAIDISTLMSEEGVDMIDLLKIDIEGGELDLFCGESCRDWLPRCKNLAIELHGPECTNAFFKALDGFTYTLLRSGEHVLCMNISPSSHSLQPQ